MIKFYKSISDYAKQEWICRQTAMKYFRNWKLDIVEVPKDSKFIWIKLNDYEK